MNRLLFVAITVTGLIGLLGLVTVTKESLQSIGNSNVRAKQSLQSIGNSNISDSERNSTALLLESRRARTKMILCTMVMEEATYVVEWAVFHLQQGYDQVRLYIDRTTDKTDEVINTMFANVTTLDSLSGKPIRAVTAVPANGWGQGRAFRDCGNYAEANDFDWVAVHDIDEYHFSPRYRRTDFYASKLAPNVTSVFVRHVRFGTNGYEKKLRWPDLVTETHIHRAPWRHGSEDAVLKALEQGAFKEGCDIKAGGWPVCGIDGGKSMTRTRKGCVPGVHEALNCDKQHVIRPDISEFRGNHYYIRSVEDALLKSRIWHKSDPAFMVQKGGGLANNFSSAVYDDSILRFVPKLRAAMEELRSDPTIPRTIMGDWLWQPKILRG